MTLKRALSSSFLLLKLRLPAILYGDFRLTMSLKRDWEGLNRFL